MTTADFLQECYDEYKAIRALPYKDPKRPPRFSALAKKAQTDAAMFAFLAKCGESAALRSLGKHEAAVVAFAEALENVDAFTARHPHGLRVIALRDITSGLSSALDVPEVEFSVVDELLDKLQTFADNIDIHPGQVWRLRVRRLMMEGKTNEAERWIERLIPTINYTNAIRYGQGCPNCVLGSIAWLRGPEFDVEELGEMLAPVFAGNTNYPGEDKAFVDDYFADRGGGPGQCDNGLQMCSTSYGRALLYHGDVEKARKQIETARSLGPGGVFLMPEIASLELALATGEDIETHADHLLPLATKHEDIEEKFLAELRLLAAYETLGRDTGDLLASARVNATRLDQRIGASRHQEQLARQLEHGPDFLEGHP